jgi:hypothetical protein
MNTDLSAKGTLERLSITLNGLCEELADEARESINGGISFAHLKAAFLSFPRKLRIQHFEKFPYWIAAFAGTREPPM